jgi:hypothetical protein
LLFFSPDRCVRQISLRCSLLFQSFFPQSLSRRAFDSSLAHAALTSTFRNLVRWAAAATILATVALAQSITLSSPVNGATVVPPVHFVATANGGSHPVSAVWIYVDNQPVIETKTASVDTTLSLAPGSHKVVATMWNSIGQLASQLIHISVSSGSISQYQNAFTVTSAWMSHSSQPDGSMPYTTSQISPYFANIAAIGMTRDPNRMPQVVAWMNWYLNHLNWPDKWGLYGTVYDYTISNGVDIPTNDADSTDSYAATFLSLAWNAWESGDPNARSFIAGLSYQLDVIGGVLVLTQQSDGLTWAKPDYQTKYLMDNCEAYRGLRDLASLYQNGFGDSTKAAWYNAAADRMLNGILSMWLNGNWAVYKDSAGNLAAPNLGKWYPDASAQVFPMLMGVVSPSDARAQQTYAAFNAAWPGWPTLSFNSQDAFPWVLVADAAAAMGDNARVATYINSIQNKYLNSGFPWPFYNAEAGWFIRANNYMLGRGL